MRIDRVHPRLVTAGLLVAALTASCVNPAQKNAGAVRYQARRTIVHEHDQNGPTPIRSGISSPILRRGTLQSLEQHLMPIAAIPVPHK